MSTVHSPGKNTEKRASQWDELMRKFSRAHEEHCRQTIIKIPQARRSTKYFPTGSHYEGSWDVLGMSGYGKYTFPNGVMYEGEFEDGMFHGFGELLYPDGTTVQGVFKKGVITNRKLIFSDGLIYEEENWGYCKMPDRRYTSEYDNGLEPAGRSNITAEMPPRPIPPGFYDTGDGFYNPKTLSVYKADDLSFMLRSPSEQEQKWILENCRTAPEYVLGPRVDLYEEWMVPELRLPHVPYPAASTRYLSQKSSRFPASESDMSSISDENQPKKLSTLYGFETSCGTAMLQESSNVSKFTSSRMIDEVKSYNKKLEEQHVHLKFSTVPTNYSELFSQNINVGLATLFPNPKDPECKYSELNGDNESAELEISIKDQENEKPNKNSIDSAVLAANSEDVLPNLRESFKVDEDQDSTRAKKSLGLTPSLLRFMKAGEVIPRKDTFEPRRPSDISEVQIGSWSNEQIVDEVLQ